MDNLPQDFISLCVLVFVLGIKHGFDADHLAAIDGLTRFNAARHARLARLCGLLFSLGHGAVVLAIALVVSTVFQHWQTPEWLNQTGAWISVSILTALAVLNIRAVLTSDTGEVVAPVGLRTAVFGRLIRTGNPLMVAGIGALFALSFDTISQAALFALTAVHFGGWLDALLLGLLFMFGMLVTDAINGFWIAHLIRRADRLARLASRILSLTVAGVSLAIAAFGAARLSLPAVDDWFDGGELLLSGGVLLVIAGGYLLALRAGRIQPATSQ